MGFFSGRVTLARYKIHGQPPNLFGTEHLEQLVQRAAGRQRLASADGIEIGWIAGDHILDLRFDLAKNIINDMLHFALRIDSTKIPGDLFKAYYQTELDALAAGNPSGRPSARQKREARENATLRLEEEAKDGRYTKRKMIPVVWERRSNELWFGTTSLTNVDQLLTLFQQTFGCTFEAITAGTRAHWLAELHGQTRNVDDAQPSVFVPGISPHEIVWVPDEHSRDFIGNEFLLWLWYRLETEGDTLVLADQSEVAVMLTKTLTLECPRGQTGYDTISSDGPTRLPEARRAIQAGKLPRKVGMILVRHDLQYEFTLHAETLGIGSAKLPNSEETDEHARLDERADHLRSLVETVDLLYDAFGQVRFHADWSEELTKMQQWLQREERPRRAAIG